MIKSWRTCSTLALALLLAGQMHGAAAVLDSAAIEQSVKTEMQKAGIPGAAIGVIQGDRLIFSGAFGVASVDPQVPVDPGMLFRLGSTTKMLTATAVLSLAAEGEVDLNTPVSKYIKGLHSSIGRLTAHQLLTHTAGLKDQAVMNGPHDDSGLGAGIRQWNADRFFTQPGAVFSYANPGYWLAGYLVETVTGKPYADAMVQQVFRPLGMDRSTIRPLMAMTWPLAQGHENGRVLRPAPDNSSNWPAGSAYSSIPELSRFVIALMNGGRLEGKQAIPAQVVALLMEPHVKTTVPGSSYGYGLRFSEHRGVRWAEHEGARAGYASLVRMAPEQHTAVIVLTNAGSKFLPDTTEKILEMLLPLAPAERPRRK
jgi:CubicO group peptidase (beta-lactamase class C family)